MMGGKTDGEIDDTDENDDDQLKRHTYTESKKNRDRVANLMFINMCVCFNCLVGTCMWVM